MPGPYWVVKGKQSATGRNPSGAAAPPPFDKGGRGAVCNIIELKLGSTTDTLHENAGRFYVEYIPKTVYNERKIHRRLQIMRDHRNQSKKEKNMHQ